MAVVALLLSPLAAHVRTARLVSVTAARRAGLTPIAIRFYEAQGLLRPHRAANGVRALLPDRPRRPCTASQDCLPAEGEGGFRAGLGAERFTCPPSQTCAREPGGREWCWFLLATFPIILCRNVTLLKLLVMCNNVLIYVTVCEDVNW